MDPGPLTTKALVLALYVLAYRPVRWLYFRRLGRFGLLRLPLLDLFLYRIFLRRLPARSQRAHRDEEGRQDENGSGSSPHVPPSLKTGVLFRGLPVLRTLLTLAEARSYLPGAPALLALSPAYLLRPIIVVLLLLLLLLVLIFLPRSQLSTLADSLRKRSLRSGALSQGFRPAP